MRKATFLSSEHLYGLLVHAQDMEQPVICIISELLALLAQVLPLEIVSWQQHQPEQRQSKVMQTRRNCTMPLHDQFVSLSTACRDVYYTLCIMQRVCTVFLIIYYKSINKIGKRAFQCSTHLNFINTYMTVLHSCQCD